MNPDLNHIVQFADWPNAAKSHPTYFKHNGRETSKIWNMTIYPEGRVMGNRGSRSVAKSNRRANQNALRELMLFCCQTPLMAAR